MTGNKILFMINSLLIDYTAAKCCMISEDVLFAPFYSLLLDLQQSKPHLLSKKLEVK